MSRSTTSITAANGSSQGYTIYDQNNNNNNNNNEHYIDARQASRLSARRLRAFQREESPFQIRDVDVQVSEQRMRRKLDEFDAWFGGGAAGS